MPNHRPTQYLPAIACCWQDRLRQEAEAWSQARNAYLLTQLQAGKHPDTHPDFWSGFAEPPLPLLTRAKADPQLNLLSEFDGEGPVPPTGAAGKK